MEKIIKDLTKSREGFKVVESEDRIESINTLGQVFHFIEKKYLDQGILYHGWVNYRTNEQMRTVLDGHVIELIRKNRCRSLVADIAQMTGSWTGVQDWLDKEFFPKVLSSGVKKQAVILPKNVFAQLALDNFEDNIVSGLDTFVQKNFDNEANALAWLS